MESLHIELSQNLKQKPDPGALGFGQYFSDHMLTMEYSLEAGWHDLKIVPYGPIALDPSAMVFHYGQEVFEGMKAYRTAAGELVLFRPDMNLKRLNNSCERLSIPQVEPSTLLQGITELIKVDASWIPSGEENALYIRPFIIATEPCLGVRASHTYKLLVILSPVGSYYPEGIHPVSIHVEQRYVRAFRGGTGAAKTASNYAASIKAQEDAKKSGYSQVLWLDGAESKYVEEVGSMNVFFKVNGEVITPELSGSILAGVTRDSVIALLKSWGVPVSERKVAMEELVEAHQKGWLEEAFGTGTAAVISPIGSMKWGELELNIAEGKTGELSKKLYDTITGIQRGLLDDPLGWRYPIK